MQWEQKWILNKYLPTDLIQETSFYSFEFSQFIRNFLSVYLRSVSLENHFPQ